MTDPFRSARLIYRAIEEDDDPFLFILQSDAVAYQNSAPFLPTPNGKALVKASREWMNGCLLSAMICLPAPASGAASDAASITADTAASKPIPIGRVTLSNVTPNLRHHRNTMIGINIVAPYQGSGYGSEAIKWALDWAFRRAGMHKVEIGAFAYNEGAVKLYERLGFKVDGRKRDHYWHDGRWWDLVESSMLEDEWREKYGAQ